MRFAVDIEAIEQRARQIGVPIGWLAEDAGMAKSTAYNVLRHNRDPRRSTEAKLTNALLSRERALLAYLINLHPDVASELLAQRGEAA